jgi:hypothetical protein
VSKIKSLINTDVLVQCDGNIVSDMDGEKVMLSVRNGKYYNLGEIGGKIWDSIGTPASVQQVVDGLLPEYDVEPDICEEQVITFLQHLLDEGLVRPAEAQ